MSWSGTYGAFTAVGTSQRGSSTGFSTHSPLGWGWTPASQQAVCPKIKRYVPSPVGHAETGQGEATCPKSHSQGPVGRKFGSRFSGTAIGKWHGHCLGFGVAGGEIGRVPGHPGAQCWRVATGTETASPLREPLLCFLQERRPWDRPRGSLGEWSN